MGRKPILELINQSHHTIALTMYGFTDQQLLQALLKENEHGKTIKILLERKPYKANNENRRTIQTLKKNHIALHKSISKKRLIHQKTLIIDNDKALIMTFNFTHSAFKNERNFGLIIDDQSTIKSLAHLFASDWQHKPNLKTTNSLIISPDNSRSSITRFIQSAKKSIQIYAPTINDYQITRDLIKAAHKHIIVSILTSENFNRQNKGYKQYQYLKNHGIRFNKSNLYIHAKVIIIDNKKALLGSINLTRASLDENREVSIFIEDPKIIAQLSKTFSQDQHKLS